MFDLLIWAVIMGAVLIAALVVAIQYGKAIKEGDVYEREADTRNRARNIRDKLARLRKSNQG